MMKSDDLSLTPYRITVLLVDDQNMIGEEMRRMLSTEPDIDFHYCQNPIHALKVANQVMPTVILQDLVMPQIDGLTLVRYFRANPASGRYAVSQADYRHKQRSRCSDF